MGRKRKDVDESKGTSRVHADSSDTIRGIADMPRIVLRERLPDDCPDSDERARDMINILVRIAIRQLTEEDRLTAASTERKS